MQRPGYEWGELSEVLQTYHADSLEGSAGCIVQKTVQQQDISSTQIREKWADDEFVQDALAPSVRKYLSEHQIYAAD